MSLSGLWPTGSAAQPHAGHLALATRNLEHARAHLSGYFADHRLRPEGRLQAIDFRHYHAPLGGLSLNALQYGAAVTVNAPALSEFYLMQFTLAGACEITCGRQTVALPPGSILIMNPIQPYQKRWNADCRQLIVRIDSELLHAQLARMLGYVPRRTLEFAARPVSSGSAGATLARLVEFICRDIAQSGSISRRTLQRSTGELVCAAALSTIDHSYRDLLERPAEQPLPRFVRRAEEYLRVQACGQVNLADVAAVAGVSVRTLHRGFRSFLDTTPLARLKVLRLEAAREMLLLSGRSTVTEVAMACGLPHLGKFAGDYRSRFGERPSETLRRR